LVISSAAKSLIAAVLGVAKEKYRRVAWIYASVFWNLLVRNPIRVKGWRYNASTSPRSTA
jgi:hypothetical protein